jgi:hypothetical protein
MRTFGTGLRRVCVLWSFVVMIAVLGLLPTRPAARAAEADKEPAAKKEVLARGVSGNYTILVDGVRHAGGRGFHTEQTGFPMFSGKPSLKTWSNETHSHGPVQMPGGTGGTASGSTVSGMAGGGGGSHVTRFTRPNLVLDLKVEGPRQHPGSCLVCEVNGKVRAEDDQGNELESPGFAAWERIRLPGVKYRDGDGRTAVHLYRPNTVIKAKSLRLLEGQLLVAEAKQGRFVFEGKELARETSKTSNGTTAQLIEVKTTPQGVDVTLEVPLPPLKNERDPAERIQRFMASQGRLNVTLEDDQGHTYRPFGCESSARGGTKTVTHSSSGPLHRKDSRGAHQMYGESHESSSAKVFRFGPLPNDAKPKAVHCTVTDLLGESKAVNFSLKDIPLPDAANR